MTEDSKDVYKELQKHLDQMPIGYPTTKSGVEMRLLKRFFTPIEAEIAIRLHFSWERDYETLDKIFEKTKDLGLSKDELEKHLDQMAEKGIIYSKTADDVKAYANAMFLIGMYEHQVNRLDKEFLNDFFQYLTQAMGLEIFGTKISQFRTVPVEESLEYHNEVANYDELRTVISELDGPLAVANCVCRQATDLLGHPCKVTDRRELCLGFGHMAQYYIDHGLGREISKEEALTLLRKNEEEGLVLQAGNALRPAFICSCCGCCCPVLRGTKIFPRPVQFFSANYYAEVDRELCSGCETCVQRCQMNAIRMVKELAKINLKKCIGCGNCVPTCPEEAIQLIKKDQEIDPPPTTDELYDRILERKLELKGKK